MLQKQELAPVEAGALSAVHDAAGEQVPQEAVLPYLGAGPPYWAEGHSCFGVDGRPCCVGEEACSY